MFHHDPDLLIHPPLKCIIGENQSSTSTFPRYRVNKVWDAYTDTHEQVQNTMPPEQYLVAEA